MQGLEEPVGGVLPVHRERPERCADARRHRFKTVGMEAGIPTRVLDAIQGHAPRTAAEGYGEVTIKTMVAAIERLPRVEV